MRVLIIPQWLSSQQDALNIPLSAYVNPQLLQNKLSTEDLAAYFNLQLHVGDILGKTIESSDLLSCCLWSKMTLDEESLSRACRLADYVTFDAKTWVNNVFAGSYPASSGLQVAMSPVVVSEDTIGVFFEYVQDADPVALRKTFLSALINILYAFNAFENIAKQPFFKEYLYLVHQNKLPNQSTIIDFTR